MTETARWVYQVCEQIVQSGRVRLYHDLYKDLRASLPCGAACRLIEAGLRHTRYAGGPDDPYPPVRVSAHRARAIAACNRLSRYADLRNSRYWPALSKVTMEDWR